MKVVSIAEVQHAATRLVSEARASGEPILIVEDAQPAAYVVGAEQFESMQQELRALRRAELLADVADADEELRADAARHHLPRYRDVDQMLAELLRD